MEHHDEITLSVGITGNLTATAPPPVELTAEPITLSVGFSPANLTVIIPEGADQ